MKKRKKLTRHGRKIMSINRYVYIRWSKDKMTDRIRTKQWD